MDFSEYKNLWVFIETSEGKAVSRRSGTAESRL